MHTRRINQKGFTLVEILIVVVILGILAAIVVPQFTSASEDAIKSSLDSQLQTIGSQVELYRVKEQGAYPDLSSGWDPLTTADYLKDEPFNGYTGETSIESNAGDNDYGDRTSTSGWYTADLAAPDVIFATGYDADGAAGDGEGLLAHETGFGT